MALLIENEDGTLATQCALCEHPLAEPIFATSHFIEDESDRLFCYSDAAMHWHCYADWDDQQRFAAQYFDTVVSSEYKNPYWPTILSLPTIYMRANCDLSPPVADIDLRSIGPGPRVNLDNWTDWLAGAYRETCSHPLELAALDGVIEDLRSTYPTFESIKLAVQSAKDAT